MTHNRKQPRFSGRERREPKQEKRRKNSACWTKNEVERWKRPRSEAV